MLSFKLLHNRVQLRCKQLVHLQAVGPPNSYYVIPLSSTSAVGASVWRLVDQGLLRVEVTDRPDGNLEKRPYIVSAAMRHRPSVPPTHYAAGQMTVGHIRYFKQRRRAGLKLVGERVELPAHPPGTDGTDTASS